MLSNTRQLKQLRWLAHTDEMAAASAAAEAADAVASGNQVARRGVACRIVGNKLLRQWKLRLLLQRHWHWLRSSRSGGSTTDGTAGWHHNGLAANLAAI